LHALPILAASFELDCAPVQMAAVGGDTLAILAADRQITVGVKIAAPDEGDAKGGEWHEYAPRTIVPIPPLPAVDRRNPVVAQSSKLDIGDVGAPHAGPARPDCETACANPLPHHLLLKRPLLNRILLQPSLQRIPLDALLLKQLLVIALIGLLKLEPLFRLLRPRPRPLSLDVLLLKILLLARLLDVLLLQIPLLAGLLDILLPDDLLRRRRLVDLWLSDPWLVDRWLLDPGLRGPRRRISSRGLSLRLPSRLALIPVSLIALTGKICRRPFERLHGHAQRRERQRRHNDFHHDHFPKPAL
jgi:hypothetical protein